MKKYKKLLLDFGINFDNIKKDYENNINEENEDKYYNLLNIYDIENFNGIQLIIESEKIEEFKTKLKEIKNAI